MQTLLNLDKLSIEELDAIALMDRGVIGELTEADNCTIGPIENKQVGDWRFIWVGRNRRRDVGILVLKPTNSRTKSIIIQGRTRHIKLKWHLSNAEASEIIRATKGVRFVMEDDVMDLIVRTRNENNHFWTDFDLAEEFSDIDMTPYAEKYPQLLSLNRPRLMAAREVVYRYRENKRPSRGSVRKQRPLVVYD